MIRRSVSARARAAGSHEALWEAPDLPDPARSTTCVRSLSRPASSQAPARGAPGRHETHRERLDLLSVEPALDHGRAPEGPVPARGSATNERRCKNSRLRAGSCSGHERGVTFWPPARGVPLRANRRAFRMCRRLKSKLRPVRVNHFGRVCPSLRSQSAESASRDPPRAPSCSPSDRASRSGQTRRPLRNRPGTLARARSGRS